MRTPERAETFTDVLTRLLRHEPGRPLLTFYDEDTGERVELSVTTYANWVAKVASLLAEEHDLERGQRLRVDLPTHWLGPVFLGAAWTVGLVVAGPGEAEDTEPDAVVCGPGSLPTWAGRADRLPVLACALRPLGVRFADGVPAGVHDVGVDVWSQPDAFVALDPPSALDPAHTLGAETVAQAGLWGTDGAASDPPRVLTEANPVTSTGLASFTEPLARGGSLVLVTGAARARLEAIAAAERVTARFPAP